MKSAAIALLLGLLLALPLPHSARAEIVISDARIKHLPPSVPVRAGYLVLRNDGAETSTLRSVRSDAFASVEIHRSVMHDGMMQMEAVERLEIPPGGSVELAPGGYHLMLMQPVEPTQPGETIEIILQFDDGTERTVDMTVVK